MMELSRRARPGLNPAHAQLKKCVVKAEKEVILEAFRTVQHGFIRHRPELRQQVSLKQSRDSLLDSCRLLSLG